jgi:polyphosphate kinase
MPYMDKDAPVTQPASPAPRFLNRDLSWIDFNERVLEEGLREDLPLLERFRFLSIVSSNFDEFFMVRVAAIKRALGAGTGLDPSGLGPAEQLERLSEKAHAIVRRQYACLLDEIFPGLARGGLELLRPDSWTVPQMDYLESFFIGQVYPLLTPLRIQEDQNLPFIESRSVNAAFLLVPETAPAVESAEESIVIVRLPPALSRIIWLPGEDGTMAHNGAAGKSERLQWALLDDVMLIWGGLSFPRFSGAGEYAVQGEPGRGFFSG